MVPGIESCAKLRLRASFAARAGYPILVKAAAGGGGRGMRVVAEAAQLEAALEAAAREAAAAFGDGRIFIEKYLAHPRHIEIQILGDENGNVVALGERECSIQRRHQKIIEESPAPGLSDEMRAKMIDAALKLARAAHYTSAGTVGVPGRGRQFLLPRGQRAPASRASRDRDAFRMRPGLRAIANRVGRQGQRRQRLRAERRSNAASMPRMPNTISVPRPARVLHLNVPGGPGVRFDSHLARGAEVTPWYDGLLGKLICYGADREQARGGW